MQIAETMTFGGSGLDRSGHLRGDAAAKQQMLSDPKAGVLVFWRGKPLVQDNQQIAVIPFGHAILRYSKDEPVFLGLDDAGPRFAADISSWQPEVVPDTLGAFIDSSQQRHPELQDDYVFAELRAIMGELTPRDAELAASAKAILGWHESHGFCAKCGVATVIAMSGWQRDCPACEAHHFPRTDPVVIMLITHTDRVLLGRSPAWPQGMYSLLAGFVEPGETLEAAVRREVFEEAGVKVGKVEYLASQPWPFPASLMLGCRGQAEGDEIIIDENEIEDALWISRDEMLEVLAGRHPRIKAPRKAAIAGFILTNWVADRLD
jgi:NAD+ diphosphatase